MPLVILLMKLVLPTAASPANTTLYVLSGGPVGSTSLAVRHCDKAYVVDDGLGAADGANDGLLDLGAGTGGVLIVVEMELGAADST